jgi:hypothetical protein
MLPQYIYVFYAILTSNTIFVHTIKSWGFIVDWDCVLCERGNETFFKSN